jgi:c-di-GMP-binding flagellar brake protein YcgR
MANPQQEHWAIQRASPRFQIDLRVMVRTVETLHGRTKDISCGGMAATIAGDIKLDEIVELVFQFPETSAPLRIMAEVRYHLGFQYGFRFINPTQRQVAIIRRCLDGLPLAP